MSLSETSAQLVEARAELASRGAAAISEADAARAAERRVAEAELEATTHILKLKAEERVVEVSAARRDRARSAPRSREIGAEIARDWRRLHPLRSGEIAAGACTQAVATSCVGFFS